MTNKSYTFADLRTIVPATTPAWIRVIEVYQVFGDDDSRTKEWCDYVFPVLAYATLPDGEGAFLLYDNEDINAWGPTWATRFIGETAFLDSKVRIELSIGTLPAKGQPCAFTKGAVYDEDPCPMSEFSLLWIL